jgi:RimJ/RimL family protein N-acetyltransferase
LSSNVSIRPAKQSDKLPLFNLLTTDEKWTQFNGPYFPYTKPTPSKFEKTLFADVLAGERAQVIDVGGRAVGTVSCYWENENTRWLEAGVVIYDSTLWGRGIAQKALKPWITHLFELHDIARVGMTTWSGNQGMMKCAQKLGLHQEARLRKVRYYQGKYYDSVKYGVLREEWFG